MPVNLSIKNAPDDVVDKIRARAKAHHRSLQGELMAILEEAALVPQTFTVSDVMRDIRALNFKTKSESTQMIREDRDKR
jgi:plasmid stability protein